MNIAVLQFPGSNCDQDAFPSFRQRPRAAHPLRLAQGDAGSATTDLVVVPGRLFLRRLPALRRDRALLAGHGRGPRVCAKGRPGPRHLQRLPDPVRGGPAPGRPHPQHLARIPLPDVRPGGGGRGPGLQSPRRSGRGSDCRSATARATTGSTRPAWRGSRRTARSSCATWTTPTAPWTTSRAYATSRATSSA